MVRFLINRPIAVTMTLVAIITLGILATKLIPVSLMPDVDIPQITVQVSEPELSARQINGSIINSLRQQLMQVPNLKDIHTKAKDGSGTIFLQFDYGSNIDLLFIEVNEKIDRAMASMSDIERPKIMKASATDIPAFYLNINLKDTILDRRENYSFSELSRYVSSVIVKRFEQLPEVAMVDISGMVYPELIIIPDIAKIEAAGLTLNDLENAINNKKISLANLIISDGQYQYHVRFNSTLTNKSDIENAYINANDKVFQIKDLASIVLQNRKQTGLIRSDGKETLTLAIIKQSDARMEKLRNQIDKLITILRQENPQINFSITRDQTALLDYSINNLQSNLLSGVILACLVIFLFMQDLRSPLLITGAIPISLVVSILLMYALGITINIISLSGLVLGVGMMVDNSIIVIDNISQRWDRGESLQDAIVRGTNEVFAPMLSSVLTTCAVFIPLIFMSNIAGELFYDQAMAVAIGLFASLGVAVLAIPVYYHIFYRKEKKRKENRFLKKIDVIDYEKIYETGLKWTFRHQGITWILVLIMLTGTVWLFANIKKSKLPDMTKDDILVNIAWNEHINLQENDRRISQMLSEIDSYIQDYTAIIGEHQFMLAHTKENSTSESVIYIKSHQPEDINQIEASINQFIISHYSEAVVTTQNSGNIFDMIFSDSESNFIARIRPALESDINPDQLNLLLASIQNILPNYYIEPIEWQEVIVLRAIPQLMALYDIRYETLSSALKIAFNEHEILSLREGEYSIPIMLGDGEKVKSLQEILENTTVTNNHQVSIPISQLVRESREKDLKNIISGQEGIYYPLRIEAPDNQVKTIMKKIETLIRENNLFDVNFSGSYFSNREMIIELMIIFLVSILLLYFILASQFESLIQPMIILSEIAIDLFGALVLLWLCGSSLNIMSLIGIVVMCGIVINDSILKIDTINRLRRNGYELKRAIMMAGNRRLKPIIMTSLTTILAIAPFLVTGSMGADLQFPLSLAIIGGMTLGTVVSVFFIPLIYYYIYKPHKTKR